MQARSSFATVWLLLVSCILLVGAAVIQVTDGTQASASHDDHVLINEADIEWGPPAPGLPPGAEMAVLEGNPGEEGPFTVRAKLPADYRIAPHQHPGIEHLTILSGTFHIGTGEQMDTSQGQAISAGGFAVLPPEMIHYAWTTEETVLQLHGIGPWDIIYVDDADDPRNQPQ